MGFDVTSKVNPELTVRMSLTAVDVLTHISYYFTPDDHDNHVDLWGDTTGQNAKVWIEIIDGILSPDASSRLNKKDRKSLDYLISEAFQPKLQKLREIAELGDFHGS